MAFVQFDTIDSKNFMTSDNKNFMVSGTVPITTYDINLYECSAEVNRVDKSSYLTTVGTINGTLRGECSILKPSIAVEIDHLPTCNYVYIPQFNRYYWITGITSIRQNLWRIDLDCDVLMSYKAGIKGLVCVIARQEHQYNDLLVDSELPVEANDDITYTEMSGTPFSNNLSGTAKNILLTVIGA